MRYIGVPDSFSTVNEYFSVLSSKSQSLKDIFSYFLIAEVFVSSLRLDKGGANNATRPGLQIPQGARIYTFIKFICSL